MIKSVIAASAFVIADRRVPDFFRNGGPLAPRSPQASPATFAASE
jgi:hypothetical protein